MNDRAIIVTGEFPATLLVRGSQARPVQTKIMHAGPVGKILYFGDTPEIRPGTSQVVALQYRDFVTVTGKLDAYGIAAPHAPVIVSLSDVPPESETAVTRIRAIVESVKNAA